MGYPKNVTVGALLDFLNDELKKGNVNRETKIFVEEYALTREETLLKNSEEQLDYHIPDDNCDEMYSFKMGVWQTCKEGTSKDGAWENYIALSTYLRADSLIWSRLNPKRAHERTIYPNYPGAEKFFNTGFKDLDTVKVCRSKCKRGHICNHDEESDD